MSEENSNKKNEHGYGTTGHSWDGIEEWNNPLPRWWVWCFYLTIIWGIGYTIAYPAWPGLTGSTAGVLGWSTRANVAEAIAEHEAEQGPMNEKLVAADLTEIRNDPELLAYAQSKGEAVFETWCAQCHGTGGAGVKAGGYPNLLDNSWLWGGDIESIYYTVSHGIRNDEDEEARYSEMPAFGDDYLEPAQIDAVVNYVMSLSGAPQNADVVADGAVVFEEECSSCHMEDGTGDRAQGAPNLADAIWLYGGDYDTVYQTVSGSRFGVMPAWSGRLDEASVRAAAVYVHTRGGGE